MDREAGRKPVRTLSRGSPPWALPQSTYQRARNGHYEGVVEAPRRLKIESNAMPRRVSSAVTALQTRSGRSQQASDALRWFDLEHGSQYHGDDQPISSLKGTCLPVGQPRSGEHVRGLWHARQPKYLPES